MDVRDVAAAHCLALFTSSAKGRYICSSISTEVRRTCDSCCRLQAQHSKHELGVVCCDARGVAQFGKGRYICICVCLPQLPAAAAHVQISAIIKELSELYPKHIKAPFLTPPKALLAVVGPALGILRDVVT